MAAIVAATTPPPVSRDAPADLDRHCPPIGDNNLFLENMAALWRSDPKLAQRIDEVPDERRIPLVRTRSGNLTAAVDTPRGPTFLHSRYDPVAEAKRFIDSVAMENQFCFVVCGFGLGHHVLELDARLKGDAVILVMEPSLPLLATALSCLGFAELISSGRLIIVNELDKATLHEKLKPHNTLMLLGARFVAHPPSIRTAEKFHAEGRKLVTDYIAYSRMTLLTLVGNAEITCRNIAHNLPRYLSTPPINILRNRFKGHAGIVISGGPSLRKNIEVLAEAKGRAVLCAVQTTFKPLLSAGIVPDFVTSLDFHAISEQYFHGLTDLSDVHLVAEPKVSWHVLDEYRGPVSILHNGFADLLIGSDLARRDGLKPGATVAHLAFYLLEYMGCDPIIFIGQDLAFTGHCFYVPGVETHHTWRSEINRFNSLETKEWERIVRNRSILRKINDINGREIYTDELLFTYLEQFERDFAVADAKIIDATEGGARMRGTEVITLRDTIRRYCTRPLPANAFAYRKTCNWRDTTRWTAARREIHERLDEIRSFDGVCEEMLSLLSELKELTDDPDRFNRRLIRVDELRAVIARSGRAHRIINAGTQLAELQRFRADRKLGATDATGTERALRQLDRDVQYVQSFRDGAAKMIDVLSATIDRFDAQDGSNTP